MGKTCGCEDVSVPSGREGLAPPPSPGCVSPGQAPHLSGLVSVVHEKWMRRGWGRAFSET